MTFAQAASPEAISEARELFREYANEWQIDLCFQNFGEELTSLPGAYEPPQGRLLLARGEQGELAGCVALRQLAPGIGEMKRLYVRPAFRGSGLGRRLAETCLGEARVIGYSMLRLDTLERMRAAVRLYEALGFQRIEAYRFNPEQDVVYMQLTL